MTVNSYNADEDLCSATCDLLRIPAVSSISDPTTDTEARFARQLPLLRGMLLSRHDWNFANPVVQLTNNPDVTPNAGHDHAFKLPSDLIAGPFAVYDSATSDEPVLNYINANDHIHASFDVCLVQYRRNPPLSTWPLYFTDLVVVALASRMAKAETDNDALVREYRIQAFGRADENSNGGLLGAAKNIDARSEPIKTIYQNGDPLTATRY
jgi:hypothetical protein